MDSRTERRVFDVEKSAERANKGISRTAMSGLSARQKTWSGEGSRFLRGWGTSTATLDGVGLGAAFEKNLRIPSFCVNSRSCSTSEGAEDKSEESDILVGCCLDLGCRRLGEKFGRVERDERQRKLSRYLATKAAIKWDWLASKHVCHAKPSS